MAKDKDKDYTKKTFLLTATVIAALVGISFVPPFTVGGVTVKRANILSDIIDFGDAPIIHETSESLIDTSFYAYYEAKRGAETEEAGIETADEAKGGVADTVSKARPRGIFATKPDISDPAIVCIEDFSEGEEMMSRFYHSLAYQAQRRPVRIAVLGDSFIEADIITADLREQLQMEYGGSGVGFVPFSTPLSKYRGTVKHTHEGWEYHNIIKLKSVPEEYKPWFFVSGILSIPTEGAFTEYKGVQFRNRIEKTNSASLLFVNRKNSSLEVTINETETTTYKPESGQHVQEIEIRRPDISQIKVRVNNAGGFIGYGVVLEDSVGVSVHNYSVRSNSGTALFGADQGINSQVDGFMNYDMIILQYGLNAMSADVTNYSYYGRQLVRIINYIKECFPNSAIVVMSVGDRSSVKGGTASTMPAVEAMIKAQRDAAEVAGVGFWNTYDAMGGKNSMPGFVERNWASKDHTHIGYLGGKYIAGQFVAFLNAAVKSIREQNGPIFDPVLENIPNDPSSPLKDSAGAELPDLQAAMEIRRDSTALAEDSLRVTDFEIPGVVNGIPLEIKPEFDLLPEPTADPGEGGSASYSGQEPGTTAVTGDSPDIAPEKASSAPDKKTARRERRSRRNETTSEE